MRNPAKAADLEAAGVRLVPGDLDDDAALATLVAGCAAVVHGAGSVRGNCQEDFDRVNVHGTARLLQAIAAQAQPPRLVHLSSIVAREPELSWYSRSKRRGEDLLHAQDGLDWTVIRPPAVYGPGDVEMLAIFRTMARGLATVPGALDSRTSLIHVSDLAAAIVACLRSGAAGGAIFEIGDERAGGYSWPELAVIAGAVFGRRVRLWRVPAPLLDAVAALNSLLARLTGRAPMLTPPKLRELRHPDWVTDNGPLTRATGWRPAVSLEEGLRTLEL